MKPTLFAILLIAIALPSFAQIFGRDYNPGNYYTKGNQKYTGFLAMDFDLPSIFSSHPDKTLYFKPDANAKRQKIKASTLTCFTVTNRDTARTDSFVTISGFNRSRIKFQFDFVQVICDNGPVKLYNYRIPRKVGAGFSMLGLYVTYYDNYYFYGPNAGTSVEMKQKDFKGIMSTMLADDPGIVKKIENQTYTMGDMHEMLKLYNAHRLVAVK
ncbi:MAG: hypothetical protein ABI113_16940 [Mucilaginibacter sp.]